MQAECVKAWHCLEMLEVPSVGLTGHATVGAAKNLLAFRESGMDLCGGMWKKKGPIMATGP